MNADDFAHVVLDLFTAGEHQNVVWMVTGYVDEFEINSTTAEILRLAIESARRRAAPLTLVPMLTVADALLSASTSGSIELSRDQLSTINGFYHYLRGRLDWSPE